MSDSSLDSTQAAGLKIDKKNSERLRKFLLGNDLLDKSRMPAILPKQMILPLNNSSPTVNIDQESISQLIGEHDETLLPLVEFVPGINFRSKNSRGKKNDHGPSRITIQWVKEKVRNDILHSSEKFPLSVELWRNGLCVINSGLDHLSLQEQCNVASELIQLSRNKLKTIAKPEGGHHGPFRIRKYKILASSLKNRLSLTSNGQDQSEEPNIPSDTSGQTPSDLLETSIKENGVLLHLNLGAVWYSKRLEQERQRIASLIINNDSNEPRKERILCLFCGIGPFPLVLQRKAGSHIKHIYAVELNPSSVQYAQKNIEANRCTDNITLLSGDANKECQKMAMDQLKFDRIVMPAPRCEDQSLLRNFIQSAMLVSHSGTWIHFYDHLPSDQLETRGSAICHSWAEDQLILKDMVVCGQQSPLNYRVCYDLVVV